MNSVGGNAGHHNLTGAQRWALAFALLLALAGCGGGSSNGGSGQADWFATPILTELGSAPYVVGFGDFNGDGRTDVAFRFAGGNAYVMLGNGDGTFKPARSVAGVVKVVDIAVSDLNSDGKADLALTACPAPGCPPGGLSLFIMLGNGDGTFATPVIYDLPGPMTSAQSVAIGDFNGDGRADVAVGQSGPIVSVWLGNGDGTLQAQRDWPADTSGSLVQGYSIAVADVNADGRQDLVAFLGSGVSAANISVLLGHGDGAFDPPLLQPTDQIPQLTAIADFNHDGRPDIVINGARLGFQPGPGVLEIVPGKGDGTFGAPIHPYSGGVVGIGGYAVGDLDRDGNPDIVMRISDIAPLAILLGKGDGTFLPAQNFAPNLDAAPVERLVDVNGDGRLDLVLVTPTGFAVLLGAR